MTGQNKPSSEMRNKTEHTGRVVTAITLAFGRSLILLEPIYKFIFYLINSVMGTLTHNGL